MIITAVIYSDIEIQMIVTLVIYLIIQIYNLDDDNQSDEIEITRPSTRYINDVTIKK